ncbi:MAG: hypothetical protein HWE14_10525 [Flavobacteriia bacterium]|nr:hypothetical protein [Flavobacteriia bacterium]
MLLLREEPPPPDELLLLVGEEGLVVLLEGVTVREGVALLEGVELLEGVLAGSYDLVGRADLLGVELLLGVVLLEGVALLLGVAPLEGLVPEFPRSYSAGRERSQLSLDLEDLLGREAGSESLELGVKDGAPILDGRLVEVERSSTGRVAGTLITPFSREAVLLEGVRFSFRVVEAGLLPKEGLPVFIGLAPFASRNRVERTAPSIVLGEDVTREDVVLSGLTVVGMSAKSTLPLPPIDLPPPGMLNLFGVGP